MNGKLARKIRRVSTNRRVYRAIKYKVKEMPSQERLALMEEIMIKYEALSDAAKPMFHKGEL